jgi:hypothetical protein
MFFVITYFPCNKGSKQPRAIRALGASKKKAAPTARIGAG